MSDLLNTLVALEDRLAQGDFAHLLHPDFLEFGLSGRRWTRAEVLAELSPTAEPVQRDHLELQALSEDLVLLTWKGHRQGRHAAWRSSLWQRDPQHGWRMRFHQATPLPAP
jgi:ribonuclease HI